jgi:hypothetical protein
MSRNNVWDFRGIDPATAYPAETRRLRHLAVEWEAVNSFPLEFVQYILQHCPDLQSVAVMFGDHTLPENKRCWLREVEPAEQSRVKTKISADNSILDMYGLGAREVSAGKFMESLRSILDRYGDMAVSRMAEPYTGDLYNAQDKRFNRLILLPKLLVVYQPFVPEWKMRRRLEAKGRFKRQRLPQNIKLRIYYSFDDSVSVYATYRR